MAAELRVAFESGHEETVALDLAGARAGATVRRRRRWRAVACWRLTLACSWVCVAEVVRACAVVNRPVGLAGLGAARATLSVDAAAVTLAVHLGQASARVPRELLRTAARERAARAVRLLARRSGVALPFGAWARIEAHVLGPAA